MNRRNFLKSTLCGLLPLGFAETPAVLPARKLIFGAPLTHSDWMLKPGVAWGVEGVRHMLDMCKECGWSRVYWRVLDGGRALYKSRLLRPMGAWDADSFWTPQSDADKELLRRFTPNLTDFQRAALIEKFAALDYANFDPFEEAIRYGRQIGLQIHAWISINEDDHGWGLQSEFSKLHPQFRWRGANGKIYRSQLSFAFKEVRQYKLAILKELLSNYELDGLFLDWIRTGDVRDNPQNDAAGVADYGFENPLMENRKPADEEGIRLRAAPQTQFMREARKLINEQGRSLPIAALVGHPWHYRGEMNKIDGNLRGLLLDVETWAGEGLVDAVVGAGYYRDGGNAQRAWQALQEETKGKADVWTYAWVPSSIADLAQSVALADQVQARQILFWEADYIDDRTNAAEIKEAMSKRAAER